MNRYGYALCGAVALLIGAAWSMLVRPAPVPHVRQEIGGSTLRPLPAAAVDTILLRGPFLSTPTLPTREGEPSDDPADPPILVGIVGRLPDQAVALVRRSGGGTRTLSLGEAFGDWRLVSIGADAALFADGARRVRVELPKSPGHQ